MQIYLRNTLSRSIEAFVPIDAAAVRMYSCGPTVYNYAHIGNMRAFVFADLLQRVLRVVGGYSVQWVMNITDIDDKTIRDSAVGSPTWTEDIGVQTDDVRENLRLFTEFYTRAFIEDITALRIYEQSFTAMPRATHYIPQMQELIQKIAEKGFAYERGGSVYFNLAAWRQVEQYGKLFTIDVEHFREGVRIDADEYDRESVSDFVLWKGKKDHEPSWDFDFQGCNLAGRPGWHIECSAMARELLGVPFDIHTGGVDLCFPHHEDEIAQSKAGYGVDPVRYWVHNEFLEVEGEKMSKSKGNFFTLRDLLARGIDPLDVRWLLLAAHYGTKANFTFAGLEAGRKARLRVQEYIYELWERSSGSVQAPEAHAQAAALRSAIFEELAQDLQTPKALAVLFTFINQHTPKSLDTQCAAALLGVLQDVNRIWDVWSIGAQPHEEIPHAVLHLAEERWRAKQAKNFIEADRLRAELVALGYVVNDTKDGYTVERRPS
ncbi:MAG: cysteine--tRNA ligase [Bacteroidota bacterium]|nr:cysteine--tRNA ligase [Candidatus Kapabacteria bacterium]MDW8219455.1 cysteine--tRNA ligase [Bacteroidota bacterium]